MSNATPLIVIPRGLEPVACRGCGAQIWWAPHPSTGRAHPVSVEYDIVPGCKRPTPSLDGAGISHFSTCPQADRFRKPKEQSA